MRRISAYFIKILVVICSSLLQLNAQDTINIPLRISIGFDVLGPAIYLVQKNTSSFEGYISADINEKYTAVIGAGYSNYEYSQYNYTYLSKGTYLRAGVDINLLKPKKSLGKYWAGISLRYGLSRFTDEVPSFQQDNYWGSAISSIPPGRSWGHLFEVSPGVRTEVLRNFSMGWTVSLRMLLNAGKETDLRPIYSPGFGNSTKRFSTGFNYFIVWNIPYKKIRVITKKEEPEEPEEPEGTQNTNDFENTRVRGNTQKPSGEFP